MSVSDKGKGPDSSPPAGKHKRRFLSAEKKYQIFLEAQRAEAPVGELLRREGLYSTDLARIQCKVKEGLRTPCQASRAEQENRLRGRVRRAEAGTSRKGARDGQMALSWRSFEKKRMGFVGKIEGLWMEEEQKSDILASMEEAGAKGVSRIRACAMWMIDRRRVVRWSGIWKRGGSLDNGKPGPRTCA